MTVTPIEPGALYLVRLRDGDHTYTLKVEAEHPLEAALHIAALIYAQTGEGLALLQIATDPTIN